MAARTTFRRPMGGSYPTRAVLLRGRRQRPQLERQPVGWEWPGAVVDRRLVGRVDVQAVAQQELVHDRLDLHRAEVHSDALVHVAPERRPGVLVRLVLRPLRAEAS